MSDISLLQPESRNSLSPNGFELKIRKLPNVNYFGQSVALPGITLVSPDVPNPYVNFPVPGDHLVFEDLSVTFQVSENLASWLEIYNWMIGLGFPSSHQQYYDQKNKSDILNPQGGIFSEGILFILNSNFVPKLTVTFEDMFPVSLSPLQFDSTVSEIETLTGTATFKYTKYTISRI